MAVGVGLYFFAYSTLNSYTAETGVLNARAKVSDTNLASLKKLQEYLRNHESDIERIDSLAIRGNNYEYQDAIFKAVSTYAQQSGVNILSVKYNTVGGNAASSGTATPTTTAPSGLKVVSADFTTNSPLDYYSLINFVHRIERSPIKMQISSLSISRSGNDGTNSVKNPVTTQTFTIEVYVNPSEKKDVKK